VNKTIEVDPASEIADPDGGDAYIPVVLSLSTPDPTPTPSSNDETRINGFTDCIVRFLKWAWWVLSGDENYQPKE
jgi:hypothetical protein